MIIRIGALGGITSFKTDKFTLTRLCVQTLLRQCHMFSPQSDLSMADDWKNHHLFLSMCLEKLLHHFHVTHFSDYLIQMIVKLNKHYAQIEVDTFRCTSNAVLCGLMSSSHCRIIRKPLIVQYCIECDESVITQRTFIIQ